MKRPALFLITYKFYHTLPRVHGQLCNTVLLTLKLHHYLYSLENYA